MNSISSYLSMNTFMVYEGAARLQGIVTPQTTTWVDIISALLVYLFEIVVGGRYNIIHPLLIRSIEVVTVCHGRIFEVSVANELFLGVIVLANFTWAIEIIRGFVGIPDWIVQLSILYPLLHLERKISEGVLILLGDVLWVDLTLFPLIVFSQIPVLRSISENFKLILLSHFLLLDFFLLFDTSQITIALFMFWATTQNIQSLVHVIVKFLSTLIDLSRLLEIWWLVITLGQGSYQKVFLVLIKWLLFRLWEERYRPISLPHLLYDSLVCPFGELI